MSAILEEMQMKRLGNSDLELTTIGVGAWAMGGGGWACAWGTPARLKDEGTARWIGLSNFNVAQLERCRKIAPVTSLQPPYSAVSPEVEGAVLPYCKEHGIGVIVYSPMKSGLLSGKMTRERVAAFPQDDFRRRAPAFQEPHLSRNLALAGLMKEIGAGPGRS